MFKELCLVANDCYDVLEIPLKEDTKLSDLRKDWIYDAGFAFLINKEFGISITPDEFKAHFTDDSTLGEIAQFIEGKVRV